MGARRDNLAVPSIPRVQGSGFRVQGSFGALSEVLSPADMILDVSG